LFDNNAGEELRHIQSIKRVLHSHGYKPSQFTAMENMTVRMELVDAFNKGEIDSLVAIRCLDEGINIPSIKSALILSSNDNYREFVQRRGRILRLYEDNANYIEISQENESEGFEKENGYSYKEVKDSKVAVDFEINVQDELLFREVEVELNNVEYTFKYENVDNFEYIRVEVENRDIETRGLFKRVQVTNEDGSKSTYYEYVS
jgi:superfamily II DNA or RNA helicase